MVKGLLAALAALVLSDAAQAQAAGAKTTPIFHRPSTPAEIALNGILKRADADGDELDNLFHRYGPLPRARRVDYRQMLTDPLIAAMTKVETSLVKRDCGGKYLDGEICGIDYSPITCAQDWPSHYLFRTLKAEGRSATIAAAWPGRQVVATYRLVSDGKAWKIDSVACATGARFN